MIWGKTMEAFEDHQQDLVLDTLTGRMCNSLKASVELGNCNLPRMPFVKA